MARTCTYLNFPGNTEKAFLFYQSVFGGEFLGGISRFKDMPDQEAAAALTSADQNLIMRVELAITGGHVIMGTDAPESMGFKVSFGNNFYICLEPDSRAGVDRLFAALSAGGKVEAPLQEMIWGSYFGSCVDQFGVQWMFNCPNKNK